MNTKPHYKDSFTAAFEIYQINLINSDDVIDNLEDMSQEEQEEPGSDRN